MRDLFEDTTFGELVRFVTKGRLLDYPENHDEELRERYINGDGDGEEKSRRTSDEEMEKGKDYIMVDFLENDPGVRSLGNIA